MASSQSATAGAASGGRDKGPVSASFSLRCLTSNVCVFPLATRNQTAVVQLFGGLVTAMVLVLYGLHSSSVSVPLWLQLLASPFLSLPLLPFIIPLQGLLIVLASRGQWHDHKRGRLALLLSRLDEFDCLALQELFSGLLDSRHRNHVLQAARRAGLHYSVACSRVPTLPAVLLNTGTLLLSRYPIVASARVVFRSRAFYDYFIVNRGASWMRLQLPHGEEVDFFTVHLVPPLEEVAGRAGRLLAYCTCQQEAQLAELLDFMRECLAHDRPSSSTTTPKSRRSRIVLAGDFNLDAGSRRYWQLVHQLRQLDPDLVDLFALPASEKTYRRHAFEDEAIEKNEHEDEKEEEESSVANGANGLTRRFPAAPSSSGNATPAADGQPFSTPAAPDASSPPPFSIAWNEWRLGVGNGREVYSHASHASFVGGSSAVSHVRWESTFGQRLIGHPSRTRLETFLTHATLQDTHSTHDYFFTNCRAVRQRVEPFLTSAQQKLLHGTRRNNVDADSDDDDHHHDERDRKRRVHTPPPFTQLSDHSALAATLMVTDSE